MDGAYQAKRHKYDNASLIMHPLRPEENTAESILSLIRNDRSYTKAEAQLLDTLLALHADHGGGNADRAQRARADRRQRGADQRLAFWRRSL